MVDAGKETQPGLARRLGLGGLLLAVGVIVCWLMGVLSRRKGQTPNLA